MFFYPSPKQELSIENTTYRIAEHPSAPGIPYGQEGRQAVVYQVFNENTRKALKVFKPRFSKPEQVLLSGQIQSYAQLPGLEVCQRTVLTPSRHRDILKQHSSLTYAVLMPWVDGTTWQEILQENQALTQEQSLTIANTLAKIMVTMEERGMAHCDLSGSNIILAFDFAKVSLVDVEGMYVIGLSRPEVIAMGSPGYAHRIAPDGIWNAKADRFAGAILLAEILGWCDARIRKAAWGESYFNPQEIGEETERYHILVEVIGTLWGEAVASLFRLTWRSAIPGECPTLGEWLVALPERESDLQASDKTLSQQPISVKETIESLPPEDTSLDSQGTQLSSPAEAKNLEKLIMDNQNVLTESRDNEEKYPDRQCPNCSQWIPEGQGICPYCEGMPQPLLEEESESFLSKYWPILAGAGAFFLTFISISIVVILGRNGKGVLAALATDTPTPTATITPTITPSPTPLPPTPTPIPPTLTPTIPAPNMAIFFLEGVTVTDSDNFYNLQKWHANSPETSKLINDQFHLVGQKDWGSDLLLRKKLTAGEGIILNFRTVNTADTKIEFTFEAGEWHTATFKQFAIFLDEIPKVSRYQGQNSLPMNDMHGNLTLKANTWYKLLLAVDEGGEFLGVIQDTKTSEKVFYTEKVNGDWDDKVWVFAIRATDGREVYIDDFLRISFSTIK